MVTSNESPAPPNPAERILLIGGGYIASIALHLVTRHDIAGILADGPSTTAELASVAGLHEDALYRTLRLLASHGIFEETGARTFRNSDLSETLRADAPNSCRDAILWWCDPFHFRIYAELEHSLLTGETCVEKAVGLPIFDYFAQDAEESEVFNRAMTAFSAQETPAVLEAYDFSGIETLVDVGGGHGGLLTAVLSTYPGISGVLSDVDHVLAGAGPLLEKSGVASRCRLETCDFFRSVPAGGDAYLMKHIIHDWNDERSLVILRNVASAMKAKDSRLLLVEAVVAAGNEPHVAKAIDIEMLALPGGRERTEAEYRDLLAQAGFRLTRVVPTKSPVCVVEAVRS